MDNTDLKNKDFLLAYDTHSDALFRHCFYRVKERELAKDLVQEAFTKTWSYISGGKKVKNLRAFLYRVLNNLIVDHMRKQRPVSLDELMEGGFYPEDEKTSRLNEQLVIAKELIRKLSLLDEIHRVIIIMRYLDELTTREIAMILNISENAVSVRINRALKKLQEVYEVEPEK